MSASVLQSDEGRNALVAATLVGAVVLIVGFGSGIGAVAARHQVSGARGTTGRQPTAGSSAISGPPTAGTPTAGDSAVTSPAGGSAYSAAESNGQRMLPVASTSASVAPGSQQETPPGQAGGASPPGGGSTSGSCTGQNIVSQMETPLVTHLQNAHFEESPGRQANDLLNVNQYIATHTALLEQVMAPHAALVEAVQTGLDPVLTHIDRAHLQESPGQQVNDLLNVNQYIQTHTVLVEDALAPTFDFVQGTNGC